MNDSNDLEGSIRQEGNFLIGEGDAGLQMYTDTMQLAIAKTGKFIETRNAVVSGLAALGGAYLAYKLQSVPVAALTGLVGAFTVKKCFDARRAGVHYAKTLHEVVSHGWGAKDQLEKIDWRYL